jgi:anti-sigma-K factor RskA
MAKKQTKADREEGRRIRAESRRRARIRESIRREKEELRDLSPTPPPMSPPPRKPRARTINTLEGRVSPRTTATALKMSRGGLVQAKNLNRSIRGPNS